MEYIQALSHQQAMERLPRKFSLATPFFKYTAALPWHCQLAARRQAAQ